MSTRTSGNRRVSRGSLKNDAVRRVGRADFFDRQGSLSNGCVSACRTGLRRSAALDFCLYLDDVVAGRQVGDNKIEMMGSHGVENELDLFGKESAFGQKIGDAVPIHISAVGEISAERRGKGLAALVIGDRARRGLCAVHQHLYLDAGRGV